MNTITLLGTMSYPEQLERIKENMEILRQRAPATMKAFSALHHAAGTPGALDFKTKELIALAIGVSLRCNGCIAFHTHGALEGGATPEEVLDALGVAVLMGDISGQAAKLSKASPSVGKLTLVTWPAGRSARAVGPSSIVPVRHQKW